MQHWMLMGALGLMIFALGFWLGEQPDASREITYTEEHNPYINYEHYQRYFWQSPGPSQKVADRGERPGPKPRDRDSLNTLLREATDQILAPKGILVDRDQRDFIMRFDATYELVAESKTDKAGVKREQARLVMEMYDATKPRLYWRATADGPMEMFADTPQGQRLLEQAVARLLANFPPVGDPNAEPH